MPEKYPTVKYENVIGGKYPIINLADGMIGELIDWFERERLSLLVPPIFESFVIIATEAAQFNIPESDAELFRAEGLQISETKAEGIAVADYPIPFMPERHIWAILKMQAVRFVQFTPDSTSYRCTVWEDGKKSYYCDIDYNDFADNIIHGRASFAQAPENDKELSHMQFHAEETSRLIAAVMSYILYHKPDEVDEPPRELQRRPAKEASKEAKSKQKPIKIKNKKHKVIFIGANERPPRQYNYKVMAWRVRGYYRRSTAADKHLVFIPPHFCKRADTKNRPKANKYIIEKE